MDDVSAVAEISAGPTCGIIMPLSSIDGCSASHWTDVQAIIKESVDCIPDPKFTTRMVSDADEVGVIQKRIVSNIYLSDVVVCDVSGRNPNVMFELGMRLAFDRPAVIIKDDKTPYSFDTGVIEHLTYPRDLRYNTMQTFRQQLADKVLSTHLKTKSDPEHSTFLRNFGTFKVANLHTEEVKADEAIMSVLDALQNQVSRLNNKVDRLGHTLETSPRGGGMVDPAFMLARRTIKQERGHMSDETWERISQDPAFKEFIFSKVAAEYPEKPNLSLIVDKAIRSLVST